ncbi:Gfo/Idh/MocA family oxidoreductase [Alicyclobacillus mali]|uniref:Gfo/Idh/MocA family oxidoreductase n=1 Tax=Alicyclobacillus mali (ex Roth et al. 2021) TaxID=1123961 RepID=A0ABS0F3V5_9BACL|nr:Gfo/Idh/MocA family oxidoreductase [Alicyclobacillus mali (ex Roth et al. 2021)]MBF8377985.1 Gfo/Idh/MocA family oxidoreductase [Alicyclobacillus mali (ex Roth et al. 2021)]MCL6489594.1 Gfo/Idh/MocA family oxidoreductase [Alicyclobacillus mali (ex Roth et al. 2021)]
MTNYCIVGLGSRGISMFGRDLVTHYRDVARITGLCDRNEGRVRYAQEVLGKDIPGFTDFDEMLDNVECDCVIVTTMDATHDHFIVKALERGKDVITEKPMTIDAERCRRILDAERRSGRTVRVTFNYRYAPYKTEIKRLLQEGIIGEVHSVEFRWYLDTVHGADYFRRWHAEKKNSGGLFVHKATHHFDLINWWLGLEPQEVVAMGSRHYYVPDRMPGHGERCATCQVTDRCPFYLDLGRDDTLNALYKQAEAYDGYHRDQCVFSERIDIEDTMGALIRYPNGVQATYMLTAATPFEGWQVAFNGSKGRLEAFEPEFFITEEDATDFARRSSKDVRRTVDWRFGDPSSAEEVRELEIRFYPLFGGVQVFRVPHVREGHGGGDRRLKDHLFRGVDSDPYGHVAGSRAGAMSILIGVAANLSMATGQFVRIADLLGESAPVGVR